MQVIKTSKGAEIFVDDEDFEDVSRFSWYVDGAGYVCRAYNVGRRTNRYELLHRRLLGLTKGDGIEVDHINGDTLDNRRSNLRRCTRQQNLRNTRLGTTNTSGFKGVSQAQNGRGWRAQIYIHRKQIYLGTFDTPGEAHAAYQRAASEYFGEFANFGDAA